MLALGAVAGFLAGLLGIGGGIILVPFIKLILLTVGFSTQYALKVAIATSLTTILFTSVSSLRTHHANKAVLWPVVKSLAPGIVLGALLGAQFAAALPSASLAVVFALFLTYLSFSMRKSGRARADGESTPPNRALPGKRSLFGVGTMIGAAATLVGAGGGFITVPYLERHGVPMQKAVGCSAACGFPIAAAGAAGYLWAGRDLDIGPGTIGFIYWPGLIVIACASMVTANYGARTAHSMSTAALRRVFSWTLLVAATYMLWAAWKS
jgi:uncharacterized protein